MWPFSGAARNELAQSHTALSRIDVLQAGHVVYQLSATAGSVSTDSTRSVLRNMTATILDPTGALSGGDVNDALNPYACEVAVHRGVLVPGGGAEYAPMGVYRLTSRNVAGDGSIDITGQDRAIIYQGPMTGSLSISGGTPTEKAIVQLLTTRNPGLQMKTWITGFTAGPLLFSPEIDVWAEAQKLAQSVGGYLYHDRQGLLVFGTRLPANPRAVRYYSEGDGLLVDIQRAESSDAINNVVVVQKEAGSTIRAVAMDTNPASPTYVNGKYGRRVITITNPNINTISQAQQAARNELVFQLGRSETVTLSVVPDPCLDPMEAITVNRPAADLTNRTLVMESITCPLAVTDTMSIGCRKFVLTEDGKQLDSPLPVTTS